MSPIRAAIFAFGTLLLNGCATVAPSPPLQVAMWRLDCGLFDIDNLAGKGRVLMPVSCYLIRHGDDLVLFDAGLPAELAGKPQRQDGQTMSVGSTLAAQLARIGIDPAKVGTLIVSHYHGDHNGQADIFTGARLLMGGPDIDAFRAETAADQGAIAPWIAGSRPTEPVSADRDLFGDGTLRVLYTPGHTPGHISLLVKAGGKAFILTGDLVHNRDQLTTLEPPGNHIDKVRGKAEIERVIQIAAEEGATIIVGHDQRDIALLPAFPEAAE